MLKYLIFIIKKAYFFKYPNNYFNLWLKKKGITFEIRRKMSLNIRTRPGDWICDVCLVYMKWIKISDLNLCF